MCVWWLPYWSMMCLVFPEGSTWVSTLAQPSLSETGLRLWAGTPPTTLHFPESVFIAPSSTCPGVEGGTATSLNCWSCSWENVAESRGRLLGRYYHGTRAPGPRPSLRLVSPRALKNLHSSEVQLFLIKTLEGGGLGPGMGSTLLG